MLLNDRYKLLEPLGRDGLIINYRGIDMQTSREISVGIVEHSSAPNFIERFQDEARAISTVHHPNIVQVFDYGQVDDKSFVVMEFVNGTDLRRYLRRRGALDVDKAVIIAHDVALGLGYLHERGIVHGHLDLNKILIGRGGLVKLMSFRIAWMQYYAPEQVLPEGTPGLPATDVYLLGNIMYIMLTGQMVFDGDTPAAVAMQHLHAKPVSPTRFNLSIPMVLEEIVMRCLEKEPGKRFRNGEELARALERLDL